MLSLVLGALVLIAAAIAVALWFVFRHQRGVDDIPPYPGRQPRSKQGFVRLFQTSGLFIHVLDPSWIQTLIEETPSKLTLDTDCDRYYHCGAYSFLQQDLPVAVFATRQAHVPFALAYDAEPLWPFVQCMSVFDANSKNRNCCTCADASDCIDARLSTDAADPTRRFSSPYCDRTRCGTDTDCRALNAGCGPNLYSLVYEGHCTTDQIHAGTCKACSSAQWCSSEGVTDAETWLLRFATHGGHGNQCRFRPKERQLWFSCLKAFSAAMRSGPVPEDFVTLENEVNFYFNPLEDDYEALHAEMINSLMAIVFLPQEGELDISRLRSLHDHLAGQGVSLPILQLHVEDPLKLTHWQPPVNLNDGYFDLQEV